MSFSCPNYDYGSDICQKLKVTCIPGRPGCVLDGKVQLSEAAQRRLEREKKGRQR